MQQPRESETRTRDMKPLERKTVQAEPPTIEWRETVRTKPGEELLKNLAVAAALVLCAVTLKAGAVPSATDATDAILTAATGDTLLDDRLGKLSFVSTLFPEATLVFGESDQTVGIIMPVSGGMIVHAWSEAEPYTTWCSETSTVYASCDGEVAGIYHGEDEERLVQITRSDGLSCLYGNLETVSVQVGDSVQAGDELGVLLAGEDCAFEVRRDGYSVDPATLLSSAT